MFKRRCMAEGMEFLTVTLPTLGKALDRALETGVFEIPDGWRPAKDCAYPSFLSSAWSLLFEKNGVALWAEGTPGVMPMVVESLGAAVACIRQLTFLFYKYECPWNKEQENAVFEAFKTAEDEVFLNLQRLLNGGLSELIDNVPVKIYLDRAEALIGSLLKGVNPRDIKPRYGTGATACQSTPHGRWQGARFIAKLDAVYPYSEWFVSGINGLDSTMLNSKLDVREEPEPGARGILVPKDSRGPRFISAEPREFMYIQQGLMTLLYDAIERYPNVRRQVSCTDQTRNQRLALLGSQTGDLASLDLKEASDRVSWWLVTRLFPSDWVECFDACRSEFTVLPNGEECPRWSGETKSLYTSGEEVPLWKFAPMGSAVCFPVEAIVFWALCNAAKPTYSERFRKALFRRGDNADKDSALRATAWGVDDVSVFGDDIIVPTNQVGTVVQLLNAVGLQVNEHKSFYKGPFRESCGTDYFAGYLVTPFRVKSSLAGDELETLLRFNDVCNNILLKYSHWDPSLIVKLRELFKQFFGFEPPVFPSREGEEGTSGPSALFFKDTVWGQRLDGETLIRDKRSGHWRLGSVRVRVRVPGHLHNDYNRPQARLLTEIPLEESHDLGWCSVLRSLLLSGGRGGADVYAIRGRVRHKTAWVHV